MRETWNRIARLHYEDVIDLGLAIASMDQILPLRDHPPHAKMHTLSDEWVSHHVVPGNDTSFDLMSKLDQDASLRHRRQLQLQAEQENVERNITKPTDQSDLNPRTLEDWLWEDYGEDYNEHILNQSTPLLNNTERIFDNYLYKIRHLHRDQHASPDDLRAKRFLGIAALGVASVAAAAGAYNVAQIKFLQTSLVEDQENQKRMFEITGIQHGQHEQVADAIRTISMYLAESLRNDPSVYDSRLTRIENQIRDRIRQAVHAIQAAQSNRLSVDYLPPRLTRRLFPLLAQQAKNFDCELLIHQPSDLYQIEVSLLFDDKNVHLLLHVPMANPDTILRMFKLHPFPLPLFDTHFMTPQVKGDILAISSNHQRYHLQLATSELSSCHKLGQTYLCDQFSVLTKENNNSCLGALYHQRFTEAKELCIFDIQPVEERVFSLRNNKFLIYLPQPLTIPINCHDPSQNQSVHRERQLGTGTQILQLESGCSAQLEQHLILADRSLTLPSDFLYFQWEWEAEEMFQQPATEVSAELLQLKTLGANTPTLSDLNLRMIMTEDAWTMSIKEGILVITGVCIVAALLIFASILTICYVKKQKTKGNYGQLSRNLEQLDKQQTWFQNWKQKRHKTKEYFKVHYRKGTTVDDDIATITNNSDYMRPNTPPRPSYLEDYTLPRTHQVCLHPQPSLRNMEQLEERQNTDDYLNLSNPPEALYQTAN